MIKMGDTTVTFSNLEKSNSADEWKVNINFYSPKGTLRGKFYLAADDHPIHVIESFINKEIKEYFYKSYDEDLLIVKEPFGEDVIFSFDFCADSDEFDSTWRLKFTYSHIDEEDLSINFEELYAFFKPSLKLTN